MEAKNANTNRNQQFKSQEDFIKNELNFDINASDLAKVEYQTSEDNLNNESEDEPEWMDILGNGQLRKKILVKGPTDQKVPTRPNQRDFCTVKILGRLEDGKVVEDVDDLIIQLGDHEVIQGLDLAIALMNIGETAQIEVAARFAYGDRGREPDIPSGAKIIYDVELKKIEADSDMDNMNFDQRLNLGNKKREQGNWWFSREEPTIAIQCYRRALDILVPPTTIPYEDENDLTEIKSSKKLTNSELEILLNNRTKVYNNLAAAQLKTEAYEAALESVENVLRVEPENVKALFRKGRILHKKGEYTDAMTILLQAAKLDPESKAISQEITTLREKNARNSVYEKNLYRKMLGTTTTVSSTVKSNKKSKNSKSFTQKYASLLFSSNKKRAGKLAIWSLVGGTVAMVMGIMVYKLTF